MENQFETCKKNGTVTFGRFFSFSSSLDSDKRLDMSRSSDVESSGEQHLDGNYSCKFNSYSGTESCLSTIEFDIPQSYSSSVLVFFGLYANEIPTSQTFVIGVEFDGKQAITQSVDLTETGKWLNQKSVVFATPKDAKKARILLYLPPIYRASNSAYVDNLGIYFQAPQVSNPDQYTIFSDTKGFVTAHDLKTGKEIWTFETAWGFLTAKPIVVDNMAYFGDGHTQCNLYAVHADTGKKKWYYTMDGSIDATPEIFGPVVFITTSKGILYVIDKETGIERDHHDILNLPSGQTAKMYSNKLSDGILYMTSDKGIFAFDIVSKKIVLSHELNYRADCVPAILNGIAYYGDVGGTVYAMSVKTQQCIWKKTFNLPIHSSPQIYGNFLVVGCDNGYLYILNIENGDEHYYLYLTGQPVRSFIISSNRLYVTFNKIDANIYAFELPYEAPSVNTEGTSVNTIGASVTKIETSDELHSVKLLWKFNITNGVERDPIVIGNSICFAANDGYCYCLNIEDGSLLWKDITRIPSFTEPVYIPILPQQSTARRYDQFCYLMSHNSFAYFYNGWWIGNQELTLTQQLDYGARGLMLDIFKENIKGKNQIVMYHGTKWSSYSWQFLEDALREIRIWLENHPSEIVTIQFENYVNDSTLVAKTFNDAGVADLIFYADKTNTGPSGSWKPVLQNGWPSVAWMTQNNKRLVVFAEKTGDGLPYVWNYTVETKYGDDSLKGQWDERDESAKIPLSINRSLYTVNNFPTIWYGNIIKFRTYNSINSYEKLMSRTDVCKFNPRFSKDESLGWKLHLPNFLAVDFISRGENAGALRAVQEINKLWKNKI